MLVSKIDFLKIFFGYQAAVKPLDKNCSVLRQLAPDEQTQHVKMMHRICTNDVCTIFFATICGNRFHNDAKLLVGWMGQFWPIPVQMNQFF